MGAPCVLRIWERKTTDATQPKQTKIGPKKRVFRQLTAAGGRSVLGAGEPYYKLFSRMHKIPKKLVALQDLCELFTAKLSV